MDSTNNENQNNFSFNFIDVIETALKWKKQLIIIGIVAIVLAIVISSPWVIKPKYKAEVVFYPTTINSISNAIFTDLNKREADILAFGEEEEAENALQLLNSSALKGRIIRNFDLMNHYEIDKEGKSPNYYLSLKMDKNIQFKRTRHLAVEITVLDEDPTKAAEIANGIAAIYDTVKTEIIHQVAYDALAIVEQEFRAKEKEVYEMRQKLNELGQKGILNPEEAARALAEEIYAANGNPSKLAKLREEEKMLAQYASEYTYYSETLILELEVLSDLRKKYQKSKVDVEKTLPQKFILTSASVPEIKSYPVRKVVVLLSTVIALFVSLVFFYIKDQMATR
jgi:capsular polysaccharide biosynthesis protein